MATILTVDHYAPSRYAHARVLRHAGFRVLEAADGRTAIELAQEKTPDLVLLDLHLPDMHGFEVCERLKALRATRDIPIVHISATARGDRVQRESIAAGAAAFLQEPVPPQQLLRLIAGLIGASDGPARKTASSRQRRTKANGTARRRKPLATRRRSRKP